MRLSFIVTIDPVKDLSMLNLLVHSFNLQTVKAFDVVFYNQTLHDEASILSSLSVKPDFEHCFHHVERKDFLGKYPLWDLYQLHNVLLEADRLNEYFMSMHMEEFLDPDYVERALSVLERERFDILFGNLCRTQVDYAGIEPILAERTAADFDRHLERRGLKRSNHWTFRYGPLLGGRRDLLRNVLKLSRFGFKRRLTPSRSGWTRLRDFCAEDVYFMKRDFARRHNWFLRGHRMHFEDIHICEQKGVCELAKELEKLTAFPVYFNLSRIYHVNHGRYYFQLLDGEFTRRMLAYETDDPILTALKQAIRKYRAGELSLEQALAYTRQNPEGSGTQNLNYAYHMRYLRQGRRDDGG